MRNLFRCLLSIMVLGWGLSLHAQTTAIKVGKLIDPETGKATEHQVILIENDKIKAVGTQLPIPKDAEIIDLSAYCVMPGLVDAHTHLCANLSKFADMLGVDYFDEVLLNPEAYRAIRAAKYAEEMLMAGFTIIRDAGNSGKYIDVSLKRAIDEGLIIGPTVIPAGRIIAPFGGQFRTRADKKFLDNDEYFFADTKDELRKAIRENIFYGSEFIKVVVDSKKYQYNLEDLQTIVAEAANANMKVMAHCQTTRGEYNAALAGVASIEHGWNLPDSVATVMKNKNVTLVSTDFTVKELMAFGNNEQRATEIHQRRVERLARAYKAGVCIAFGTDIMVDVDNETRGAVAVDYITSFKEAEIPDAEILKIMTINAYKLLGVEKKRGLIRAGNYADIIATKDNPLENIDALRKVSFVMKNGKLALQNLQE